MRQNTLSGHEPKKLSFFPGCSLVTSARENYRSLKAFCLKLGYELVEVQDWNCCGSSSAHCLDSKLARNLAGRNFSLILPDRPCIVACPNCYKRLRQTYLYLKNDHSGRASFKRRWGTDFPDQLQVRPFLSFLAEQDLSALYKQALNGLNGLVYVPYYGCMLARPTIMNREPSHIGVMETVLAELGAEVRVWRYKSRCCGTFLSVSRPDVVTPMINAIMDGAVQAGAECLVTACSMCHLNLEVRCTAKNKLPIFHFSELLALAAWVGDHLDWFSRHVIDPRPLLAAKGLVRPDGRESLFILEQ